MLVLVTTYLYEAGRLFLAVRDLPEVDMSGGIGAEPSSPGSDPESINTPKNSTDLFYHLATFTHLQQTNLTPTRRPYQHLCEVPRHHLHPIPYSISKPPTPPII